MKRILFIAILVFGFNILTYSQQKETVEVKWDTTTQLIFNGFPQAPSATATNISGEDLPLTVTGKQGNAGTGYVATATLSYPDSNYELSNTTVTFDIAPAPITVQWGLTKLAYGTPTATATDIFGGNLRLYIQGSQSMSGTGYTATASLDHLISNYILINPTTQFDIVEYIWVPLDNTLTVQWGNTSLSLLWDEASFFYDFEEQAPTAGAIALGPNFENVYIPLQVVGAQKEVGKGYTATATTTEPYWTLNNSTTLFDIAPANLSVQWENTSLTYNGNTQVPTVTFIQHSTFLGICDCDYIVTGEQTDAGTGYTATVSLLSPADNYYTLYNHETLFDIATATLDISANNETIEYDQTPELGYTITSGQLYVDDSITGKLSVESLQSTLEQPPYPIGVHSIVQGTLTAGSNYLINFTEGELTVIEKSADTLDILVNDKATKRINDILFEALPAENGEDRALVYVVANPYDTIAIDGEKQNPRIVNLPDYGDNYFPITVTPLNGPPKDYTLVIERYYEKVVYEYPDVPTISCNPLTNGGFTFTGFQWYRDDSAIPGATGPYIRVKDNATYHCELTPNASSKLRTINIRPVTLRTSGHLTAFPNPTQGKVTLSGGISQTEPSGNAKIQVFDFKGVLILQPETNPFDMSVLPEGIYYIRMNGETVKVIKTQ